VEEEPVAGGVFGSGRGGKVDGALGTEDLGLPPGVLGGAKVGRGGRPGGRPGGAEGGFAVGVFGGAGVGVGGSSGGVVPGIGAEGVGDSGLDAGGEMERGL
jgi:hypothetical protein